MSVMRRPPPTPATIMMKDDCAADVPLLWVLDEVEGEGAALLLVLLEAAYDTVVLDMKVH